MLKIGMYVRCPHDQEAEKISDSRTFLMGQVMSIDAEKATVTVKFHDPTKLREFFSALPEVKTYPEKHVVHTTILENSIVTFKGRRVKVLCICKNDDKDNLYNYFVEYFKEGKAAVGEVSEAQIEASFTKADHNPIHQMLRYELHNPKWYMCRRIVSKSLNVIANSPFGFKNLLSTRVHLYAHQVDTIVRALSENPCRLMLADEVGLGKTIEAISIMKGMLDKRPNMRTLIVVPDSLLYQWQTEIDYKFWKEAAVWGIERIVNQQIVLISFNNVVKDHSKVMGIGHWDMCIVDETHKLLRNEDLFTKIFLICKSVENVLLLSATPILRREEEYGKLLTLLNPKRFEMMPPNHLRNLLNKQKSVQDIVFNLMKDLPDYERYELYDDFISGLEQINEEINDAILDELIRKIDRGTVDYGLSQVKLALSYIAEFYQIERGIIRHRRAEISSADIRRKLEKSISYEMAGSDIGFFEENAFNAVLDIAEELLKDKEHFELMTNLVTAVSSSPYALLDVISKNKKTLSIFGTDALLSVCESWRKATDREIQRISQVTDDIDSFHGKFAKIIDFIDQEDVNKSGKFLVFTGFTATAKKLEECFLKFFGRGSTCSFHGDKSPLEMQEAATRFQNEKSCRFMICDESGGEGRNFQMADYIIHCDLPLSPATMEQRIGRLDRIGREIGKDVKSIVVYSENTLENSLFNIFHQALKIFEKSLCGMEIAYEQIQDYIENALKNDLRNGLANAISSIAKIASVISEEVERERYYDLARQLDLELQQKLGQLIAHFTDQDGAVLMDTMLAWPHMAGFMGISVNDLFKDGSKVVSIDTTSLSPRSMMNSLYFPPKMNDIIQRSKFKNDIYGTFSRSAAVKHENLTFFAPFNPFFDSITSNAEECYKGRSAAMRCTDCDMDWAGMVLTWNVKYDPLILYRKKFSPDLVTLISRYLITGQIITVHRINNKYYDFPAIMITDQLDAFGTEKPDHLGKRDNGAIDKFKNLIPKEDWQQYVKNCYSKGYKYVKEQHQILSESEDARKELERILTANHARELFYGYKDENNLLKSHDEIEALLSGIEDPIVELDSAAFVILEKRK